MLYPILWKILILILMCSTPAFGVLYGDYQFILNDEPNWSGLFTVVPEADFSRLEFFSHFFLFFVLSALIMYAYKSVRLTFFISFFYGTIIEIIQPLFNRGAEFIDVVANTLGILVFILLYKVEKLMTQTTSLWNQKG